MKINSIPGIIFCFLLLKWLTSCEPSIVKSTDYLILFTDTITTECGYKNSKGDIVIALGKYEMCFTDTLKTYAIVVKPTIGFVAIARKDNNKGNKLIV